MTSLRDAVKRELIGDSTTIVEFAESSDFCGKPLYPLQRVLLKLIFLEEMEGWEEDALTWMINGGRGNEIQLSPGLRERRDWCRDNGYDHFSEVELVAGRRSSKGYMTGLAGAFKLWKVRQIPDPSAFYNMDIDRPIEFSCIAASFDQAKTRQFTDYYSSINRCKALQPYIAKRQEEVITVRADTDISLINDLRREGAKIQKDFAKFRVLPLAANADTLRGSASIFIVFDEMAFMMPGESRSSAQECYVAAEPSLAQFGKHALVFCNSSPYTRIGQFYVQYQLAMHPMDHKDGWYPMRFAMQAPSWALYDKWWVDPDRKWSNAIMVSPDWDDQVEPGEPKSKLDEKNITMREAEKLKEKANPDSYKVEYRGQWAEVLDAYLRPEMVDRAFSGLLPNGGECRKTFGGTYKFTYLAHCFTGDTRIITKSGTASLDSLLGASVEVPRGGGWQPATVQSFGEQPVLSVTLERNGIRKTVRATADHVWYVKNSRGKSREVRTSNLKPKDHLTTSKAAKKVEVVSPFGVAHGFAVGDGSRDTYHTRVYLHRGKDEALLAYYQGCPVGESEEQDRLVVTGCPKYFKDLPSIEESSPYLYGWLAGYFAADGTVSENARCSISSSSREHLQFVRDVCNRLGILTWGITSHERQGYGEEDSLLYRVQINRQDLSDDFFILSHHRERFCRWSPQIQPPRQDWYVVSVEDRGDEEEVFCAVVPGDHKFLLEDNILVHNCDPASTTAGFGFAMGHVEEFEDETGIFPDGVARHVVFDLIKRWNPQDFPGGTINYIKVKDELAHLINLYRPSALTFDQYNSRGMIDELREETRKMSIQETRIGEVTATQKVNWNRWEAFKTALYLGLVHVPPDCFEDTPHGWFDHSEWAKQELKFLQEVQTGQTRRVDKQELGPVTTKDVADCIAEVVVKFLGSYVDDMMSKQFGTPVTFGAEGGFQIGGRQQGGPMGGLGMPSESGRIARRGTQHPGFDAFYGRRSNADHSAARGVRPRKGR